MTALCHGHAEEDPETWFPGPELSPHRREVITAKAKAVCEQCPIKQKCRQHALDHDIRHGIWGGLTSDERRAILNPRAQVVARKNHPRTESPSEVRGVSWHSRSRKWVVVIRHGGKTHWFGRFKERSEAEAVSIAKLTEWGISTARGRSGKKAV